MNQRTNWWHKWEVEIGRDSIPPAIMAGLFIICALLLGQNIWHFVQGNLHGPERLHIDFWSIWSKVFLVIASIYLFVFAFRFPKMSVKIASALLGTELAANVLLSCVYVSPTAGHIANILGSVVRQIALIIFCFVIAEWFKMYFQRDSFSESTGGRD